MKPTLNEQLARMQKLAGIIKENQLNKDPKVSFGKFKNVEYYKVDNELYLVVTNSDNFKEIENSMDFGDRDYLKDKEKSFLNNTVDKLADEMSNYLTSIGVKNEVGDSPIGYGQEIDNLIVVIDPNDLSKLNNTQMSEGDTDYDRAKSAKRLGKKGEENIYGAGVKKGEEIEKEKMTKSKLKSKIKEMILAELNEDSTEDIDEPGALNNMYDPLAEAEEVELEDNNYDAEFLFKYFKNKGDLFIDEMREYDAEELMNSYPGLSEEEAEKLEDMLQNPLDEAISTIGDNWDFTKPKDVERKTVTAIETAFRNLDIVKNLVMFGQFTDREMEDRIIEMKYFLAMLHSSIKGISDGTTLKEAESNKVMLNGKEVDVNSIEVEGGSYNDYSDVYISVAKFKDGTDLNNDEREELENLVDMGKLANDSLSEAKKDKEVEDITVDDTEVVDAPESDMMAGKTTEVSGIQSNLQAAYAEAKALGDEKLITQIANTITYFTKAHILDTAPINEAINDDSADAIYDILSNMDNEDIINDMFTAIQKNPGMKLEDFLNQYDAGDNPGDDNDDNYDDSMDVYDDSYPDMAEAKKAKGKLNQINENMFPMLKRILR